ncbi:hypothetical protein [Orbus mooreae]|uniref:hypothetical protein n=1 Tax=Orbus mooreae TaxID=3074107 RepID=UPI00370DC6D5
MNNKLLNYLNEGKHLPSFMKDFHDQKDIFKLLAHYVQTDTNHEPDRLPNWISAHIYTIDFFLWTMARCGYSLQKSRSKIDFDNIQELIDAENKHENKTL